MNRVYGSLLLHILQGGSECTYHSELKRGLAMAHVFDRLRESYEFLQHVLNLSKVYVGGSVDVDRDVVCVVV